MSKRTPIPLTPILIELDSPEFVEIRGWRFDDAYVGRRPQDDIPWRIRRGTCRIWIDRDPGGQLVGFGTIDVCNEFGDFTGGLFDNGVSRPETKTQFDPRSRED